MCRVLHQQNPLGGAKGPDNGLKHIIPTPIEPETVHGDQVRVVSSEIEL